MIFLSSVDLENWEHALRYSCKTTLLNSKNTFKQKIDYVEGRKRTLPVVELFETILAQTDETSWSKYHMSLNDIVWFFNDEPKIFQAIKY